MTVVKGKYSTVVANLERIFIVVNITSNDILGAFHDEDEAHESAERFVRWAMSEKGRLYGFGNARDGMDLPLIAKFDQDLAALPRLSGREFMRWWARWKVQNDVAMATRVEVRELTVGVEAERLDWRGTTEARLCRTVGP